MSRNSGPGQRAKCLAMSNVFTTAAGQCRCSRRRHRRRHRRHHRRLSRFLRAALHPAPSATLATKQVKVYSPLLGISAACAARKINKLQLRSK